MLSNTIKLGLSVLFSAVLLAGCASTSQEEPAPKPTPKPLEPVYSESELQAATAPETVTPVLETVFYFEFDKSELLPAARAALTAHAAVLKSQPRAIRLEGHADERGTREYNMALGERRAIAVRDFLRAEGVNSLIEVVSYGEERPAVTASDESAWQANRRVELK